MRIGHVKIYNETGAPPEVMAKRYTAACSAGKGDGREDYFREVLKHNPNFQAWRYTMWHRVDTKAKPNGNSFGEDAGTYERLKKEDPDLFLRREKDNIVIITDEYAQADIRRPSWTSLARRKLDEWRGQKVWHGYLYDNMRDDARVIYEGPTTIKQYPGGVDSADHWKATLGFADWNTAYSRETGFTWGGNIQGGDMRRHIELMERIGAVGGVYMNEFAMLPHPESDDEWYDVKTWLQYLEKTYEAGKRGCIVWNTFMVNSKAASENPDSAEGKKAFFSLASHLLAAQGETAVRFAEQSSYSTAHDFSWYFDKAEKLGDPVMDKWQVNGSEYRRQFEGGMVRVNPSTHVANIDFTPITIPPDKPTVPKIAPIPARVSTAGEVVIPLLIETENVESLEVVSAPRGLKVERYGKVWLMYGIPNDVTVQEAVEVKVVGTSKDGNKATQTGLWTVNPAPVPVVTVKQGTIRFPKLGFETEIELKFSE